MIFVAFIKGVGFAGSEEQLGKFVNYFKSTTNEHKFHFN